MAEGETYRLGLDGEREILSDSSLNREARQLIEDGLGMIWVEGEISNLSRPSSGHMYWSLKDAQAQVRCAMFRQSNRRLLFEAENGKQVLVRARVSIYEARGDFQLIVEQMEEAGEGLLRRRFEELKRKLADEGLFDTENKQALPSLATRIGVITSPSGAAIQDVLISLRRRFPATRVLIYPTSVQGEGAAKEISLALQLADRRADCDLLILTRGGGSLEDLWAFNEEIVARSISALHIPIIVGVGHEVDFTIADFVADVRAPTPSQAAELAVPEQDKLLLQLQRQNERLARATQRALADGLRRLDTISHRLQRTHPGVAMRSFHQRLDELELRLSAGLDRTMTLSKTRLAHAATRVAAANPGQQLTVTHERWLRTSEHLRLAMTRNLERLMNRSKLAERSLKSLSPLATLERGYAIVSRQNDQAIVTDSHGIASGTAIDVRLARGRLSATVDSSEPSN